MRRALLVADGDGGAQAVGVWSGSSETEHGTHTIYYVLNEGEPTVAAFYDPWKVQTFGRVAPTKL